MPAHIYLRLGRYKDVLQVNKDAAESDERYLAANPAVQGPYPTMYYPHNVHFQMTAALMAGQGEARSVRQRSSRNSFRMMRRRRSRPLNPSSKRRTSSTRNLVIRNRSWLSGRRVRSFLLLRPPGGMRAELPFL